MSAHDSYEAWIASQREAAAPAGFADRVMQAVPVAPRARVGRFAEVALWAAALLVMAVRVGGTLAVLWTG